MSFYKDLLYYWEKIELYHELREYAKRDYYKFMLKNKLGVECNGVYGY